MFITYGLNHKTAPLELREQFSVLSHDASTHLRDCHLQPDINEAMVLSTCNRTEWYCQTDNPQAIIDWLNNQHAASPELLLNHTYCHQDQAALEHVLRVASGLDSMVLGESEIFGQMKQAYTIAKQAGTLGESLDRLFQFVFAKAKHIRHATQINAHPLSIAFVSVNLAKRIFSQLQKTNVLLIGAGETIDLVARYLHEEKTQSLTFANRTYANAQELAQQYQGKAIQLSDIPLALPKTDMVISATNSPLAIIGKGLVERALRARKHSPLFMVDLAIPRDIEPEVAKLRDVYLYNIDDLNEVVADSMSKRRDAALQAERIVSEHVLAFQREAAERDHIHLVKNYRGRIETLRDQLLTKAIQQLRQGGDPEAVIEQFARQLTNQLLHTPSIKIRQASADNNHDLLSAAAELFALD